ncbi:DUF4271 domain-containing protein [Elizabethkingia argentiflava]|uniref:DUF4271 domain-containing protein n=1 Tax=Elizabethkingia argenteiflava TaxID=2681556 RepID=A0A845PTW0_9FLAO|nr:DUF4271 domain-containing protein [Elizabethkingia argenteiflava]
MIRVIENNDWIIYSIIGIIILYIISSKILNKEVSFIEDLQLSLEESNNVGISCILSSFIYIFILSILLSQYIPIVPKFITENLHLNGYSLNKFGFTFVSYLVLYSGKYLFSYLFFTCSGNMQRWKSYMFNLGKFFRVITILFCAMTIALYFFPINRFQALEYYIFILICIMLCKIAFLLFSASPTLPQEWYYKFLYICTLQILPHLAIWKFLFF